jgi:hypothetical protein
VQVESLRERLGDQPYVLPSEEAAKKQGKEVRLSLPPSSPLPRPPAQASPRVPAIVSPNHAGGVQANPFSNVQRVEGVGRLVMEGVLRKKKSDHGMFEDPWKQKLQVIGLYNSTLNCGSKYGSLARILLKFAVPSPSSLHPYLPTFLLPSLYVQYPALRTIIPQSLTLNHAPALRTIIPKP